MCNENINFKQTLEQMECLGQRHPLFRDVHVDISMALIRGDFFPLLFGTIYFLDGNKISSGLCKSEEQMFAKLEEAMNKLVPRVYKEVA